MQYEFHPENSIIFEKGALGDKMYIVLDGNIEVWIP